MSKRKRACIIHDVKLVAKKTKYGKLWICPVNECDVKCWNGETSMPGTQEDFDYRKKAHDIFDNLWKKPGGIFDAPTRNKRRSKAYLWLRNFIGCDGSKAHIGMFRACQCRALIERLREL